MLLAGCGPTETAGRSASATLEGITLIRIVAEAGRLEVIGEETRTEMNATGTAYATTAAALEEVQFTVRRAGNELLIEALTVDNTALDAVIRVPAGLTVEIADSSGDILVRNVSDVRIDDSSGDIDIRDVGALVITDSSGEIDIDGAAEVVIREDSSGSIVIRDVAGSVLIELDSSGDIEIADIGGDVRINDDSSGDIDVRNVGGSLTILADSVGAITHEGVAGEVALP